MPADPLHNVFWRALIGPQAHFAVGTSTARRYAPGLSPILAFRNPDQPDFDALVGVCAALERLYCADWSGPAPAGWRIEFEGAMLRMVWDAPPPGDARPDAILLRAEHAAQAVELAALTRPGPFGPRTLELGEYLGVVQEGRLIAMAGERSAASSWREISGVCTHPDFQGRGHARALMAELVRRQLARGERPFLHVMQENRGAQQLYRRMGFVDHSMAVVRVVSRGEA